MDAECNVRARADCYDKLARWQFRDGSLLDTIGDLHAFMPDHDPVFPISNCILIL